LLIELRSFLVVQNVIHDLTTSFTNELSGKEVSLRDAQMQLREVASELTDLRGKIADMQQSVESADFYGERVKRLTLIMEQEAPRLREGSDVAGPLRVQVSSVDVGHRLLLDSMRELDRIAVSMIRSTANPPPTELLCKKIISQCLAVPFDDIDKLLDPLAQAVATDGNASDLNLGELNRFMSRVKGREGGSEATV
jgi:hypothetical protein